MTDEIFAGKINRLFQDLNTKDINHFELLGLVKNATHKEIETSYKKCIAEFSPTKINLITDPELKKKANYILQRINHGYQILIDYEKRAAYEKRGYRDPSAADEPEEDPLEQAKEIYRKAKTLYSQKEYHKVATVMEQAVKLDTGKPDYFLLLGKAQTKIPSLKRKAETNLNKALEMEPWNVEPHAALGVLFYSERLFKRAETYFRKALSIEPDHALSKKLLSEIAEPEKSFKDSLQKGLKKAFPSFFKGKK